VSKTNHFILDINNTYDTMLNHKIMNTKQAVKTLTSGKSAGTSRVARAGTVVAGPSALASGAGKGENAGFSRALPENTRENEIFSREGNSSSREGKGDLSRDESIFSRGRVKNSREGSLASPEAGSSSREEGLSSRENTLSSREDSGILSRGNLVLSRRFFAFRGKRGILSRGRFILSRERDDFSRGSALFKPEC
jgi:hypothetical protein